MGQMKGLGVDHKDGQKKGWAGGEKAGCERADREKQGGLAEGCKAESTEGRKGKEGGLAEGWRAEGRKAGGAWRRWSS